MITPQVHIEGNDFKTKYKFFNTYRELKKNLKSLIKDSDNGEVFVLRSRRGEWGEWFEYWKLNHKGIPYITKEGWS